MNRREFLELAAMLPLMGLASTSTTAVQAAAGGAATPAARTTSPQRILVLIKLAGGNDGLNTLIPHADPLYYQMRPTIGVLKHQILDIGDGMGMNPYLKTLLPWWNAGQLAWVQGVGYAHGDLSHFRSSDIWETAVSAQNYSSMGWLGTILPGCKAGLHGIAIGDSLGPLAGKDCYSIAMRSPQAFLSQVGLLEDIELASTNPALNHLTTIQRQLYSAGQQLSQKLQRPAAVGVNFASSEIGRDLESVATMILSGVDSAVYTVTLGGFDTHSNQPSVQGNLLHHLAGGLDSFARAMQRGGRWNDVMVVTYSEFGRRVQENHAKGTDHGAASVQLVMGGRVRGGLYGDKPALNQLDNDGNLHYTVDFRSVYGTIAQRWLQQRNPWNQLKTLALV